MVIFNAPPGGVPCNATARKPAMTKAMNIPGIAVYLLTTIEGGEYSIGTLPSPIM
jgi:hypothetical protein